jgi:hypothetical protein
VLLILVELMSITFITQYFKTNTAYLYVSTLTPTTTRHPLCVDTIMTASFHYKRGGGNIASLALPPFIKFIYQSRKVGGSVFGW